MLYYIIFGLIIAAIVDDMARTLKKTRGANETVRDTNGHRAGSDPASLQRGPDRSTDGPGSIAKDEGGNGNDEILDENEPLLVVDRPGDNSSGQPGPADPGSREAEGIEAAPVDPEAVNTENGGEHVT